MYRRALLALLAGALVLSACSRPEPDEPAPEPPPVEEPDEPEEPEEPELPAGPPSPLTGVPIAEELHEQPLAIVKIENTPQSRPQTGLDYADIVIEEVVEFGITRFMVLFHSDLPEIAGPVRSARPVDVDLVSGFGRSIFAYSGARPEVQAMLSPVPALRVIEDGAAFFRDNVRRAPHNLYLRPAALLDELAIRDPDPVPDIGWVFADDAPEGGTAGDEITINMSSTYITSWEYDEAEGVYRRLQNGRPFVTSEGDQVGVPSMREIGAANVVVLGTRHYIGPSGYPETDATTPPDGERAIVLRDGMRYEARWLKPGQRDTITLLTPDGQPFPLKPGPTWLHLPSVTDMPPPIG